RQQSFPTTPTVPRSPNVTTKPGAPQSRSTEIAFKGSVCPVNTAASASFGKNQSTYGRTFSISAARLKLVGKTTSTTVTTSCPQHLAQCIRRDQRSGFASTA